MRGWRMRSCLLLSVAMLVGTATYATATTATGRTSAQRATIAQDSAQPWEQVPLSRVAKECGLSPALLQAAAPEMSITPFAVIRYGKLCWSGGGEKGLTETYEVNSEAKTFVALLFGIVAARTDVDENTFVRDWVNPGEQNVDPIATALTLPPLNPNAKVFNLLTQTGQDPDTQYGYRPPWFYDAVGIFGMNYLVTLMDKVVKAHPEAFPGSHSISDVAKNELFAPLGMTGTRWDGVVASHTLYSNVYDMAKFGELLLRQGRWGDRQIVDPDYIYRMSHPEIEDIHTGYGYLTWLNAAAGVAALFDIKTDPTCAPFAGWKQYPHAPLYDAPNDNGGAPFRNGYDDGLFWADGAGGNFTEIHRGLDLVLVVRDDETAQKSDPESQRRGSANVTGLEYHRTWRIVRPALVAEDPVYKGNEAAFCAAYRDGTYAPDLISAWNADSGFGSVHF